MPRIEVRTTLLPTQMRAPTTSGSFSSCQSLRVVTAGVMLGTSKATASNAAGLIRLMKSMRWPNQLRALVAIFKSTKLTAPAWSKTIFGLQVLYLSYSGMGTQKSPEVGGIGSKAVFIKTSKME
ncbi:hypothetical protein EV356DRAFT_510831 [Viridothelium virens]|uniref:Uncharacterized protein n=1 Tax=Viridothelium virens TaxID=1048519 RepID=A0A6A6GVD5_VIRVR|nr:hypothetical protein EV356DRAFT_510831 [Viridothelium virens]